MRLRGNANSSGEDYHRVVTLSKRVALRIYANLLHRYSGLSTATKAGVDTLIAYNDKEEYHAIVN